MKQLAEMEKKKKNTPLRPSFQRDARKLTKKISKGVLGHKINHKWFAQLEKWKVACSSPCF